MSIHRQIDSQVLFELLDSTIVNNRNSIKYTINKPPTTIALPVGGFLFDRKYRKNFLLFLRNLSFGAFKTYIPVEREKQSNNNKNSNIMENIRFEEVQSLLDSGKAPEEIFDKVTFELNGIKRVALNGKWNYINSDGKILSSNLWFDKGWHFYTEFGIVEINEKYNYITPNGKLLSDEWFDHVDDFQEGFGVVGSNNKNKYNYIDKDGKLLLTTWFDDCLAFEGGFGRIKQNNKWNYIKPNGELLSDMWFDKCEGFDEGFGMVVLNNEPYVIDKNGKIYEDESI